MRIESKTIAPITSSEPRSSGATTTAKPPEGDVVNISTAGAAMSAQGTDNAVANRIREIRVQLAEGSYPVDLDRLASRIVDDEVLRSSR